MDHVIIERMKSRFFMCGTFLRHGTSLATWTVSSCALDAVHKSLRLRPREQALSVDSCAPTLGSLGRLSVPRCAAE